MPKQLSIGRSDDNDITLPHPFLSGQHAVLTLLDREQMRFSIRDLGSTNGTFKNDEPVQEAEFTLNDRIRLGNYELKPADFLDQLLEAGGSSQQKGKVAHARPRGVVTLVLAALVVALAFLLLTGQSLPALSAPGLLQLSALFLLGLLTAQLVQELYRRSLRLRAERRFHEAAVQRWDRESQQLEGQHRALATQMRQGWDGLRKFEVVAKQPECEGITSFYLKPHDGHPLPEFKPGQYLTFKLDIADQAKPVIRCYSLSDCFHEDYYRVSIKKAAPPPSAPDAPWGLSSSYFHDQVQVGSILDVKAPAGNFFLDLSRNSGVVLIAGGVGITPMASMLNALMAIDSRRDIWLFYGVRHGGEVAMAEHLKKVDAGHDNVHLQLCFSDPAEGEQVGRDFHHQGRVSAELFRQVLPSSNYEYYLCGPPPMMQAVAEGLQAWGVPEADIHAEAFGPASIKPAKPAEDAPAAADAQVTFARSGKTVTWEGAKNLSLLELAEEAGIQLDFGCRAGNCGTCTVAIRDGKTRHLFDHDNDAEDGACLVCVSAPDGDLVIDA